MKRLPLYIAGEGFSLCIADLGGCVQATLRGPPLYRLEAQPTPVPVVGLIFAVTVPSCRSDAFPCRLEASARLPRKR